MSIVWCLMSWNGDVFLSNLKFINDHVKHWLDFSNHKSPSQPTLATYPWTRQRSTSHSNIIQLIRRILILYLLRQPSIQVMQSNPLVLRCFETSSIRMTKQTIGMRPLEWLTIMIYHNFPHVKCPKLGANHQFFWDLSKTRDVFANSIFLGISTFQDLCMAG